MATLRKIFENILRDLSKAMPISKEIIAKKIMKVHSDKKIFTISKSKNESVPKK